MPFRISISEEVVRIRVGVPACIVPRGLEVIQTRSEKLLSTTDRDRKVPEEYFDEVGPVAVDCLDSVLVVDTVLPRSNAHNGSYK